MLIWVSERQPLVNQDHFVFLYLLEDSSNMHLCIPDKSLADCVWYFVLMTFAWIKVPDFIYSLVTDRSHISASFAWQHNIAVECRIL